MILAPVAAEVKPAPTATFAPIFATPADVEALNLGDDFGPADDSPLWDEWAAEAECRDLMDAGLASW